MSAGSLIVRWWDEAGGLPPGRWAPRHQGPLLFPPRGTRTPPERSRGAAPKKAGHGYSVVTGSGRSRARVGHGYSGRSRARAGHGLGSVTGSGRSRARAGSERRAPPPVARRRKYLRAGHVHHHAIPRSFDGPRVASFTGCLPNFSSQLSCFSLPGRQRAPCRDAGRRPRRNDNWVGSWNNMMSLRRIPGMLIRLSLPRPEDRCLDIFSAPIIRILCAPEEI